MLDTRYTGVFIRVINGAPVSCWLAIQENEEPVERTSLEPNKAKTLMWELMKAGGDRSIEIDNINPKSYFYCVSHMFFWNHK